MDSVSKLQIKRKKFDHPVLWAKAKKEGPGGHQMAPLVWLQDLVWLWQPCLIKVRRVNDWFIIKSIDRHLLNNIIYFLYIEYDILNLPWKLWELWYRIHFFLFSHTEKFMMKWERVQFLTIALCYTFSADFTDYLLKNSGPLFI